MNNKKLWIILVISIMIISAPWIVIPIALIFIIPLAIIYFVYHMCLKKK